MSTANIGTHNQATASTLITNPATASELSQGNPQDNEVDVDGITKVADDLQKISLYLLNLRRLLGQRLDINTSIVQAVDNCQVAVLCCRTLFTDDPKTRTQLIKSAIRKTENQ